jgi:hypothetical protein
MVADFMGVDLLRPLSRWGVHHFTKNAVKPSPSGVEKQACGVSRDAFN